MYAEERGSGEDVTGVALNNTVYARKKRMPRNRHCLHSSVNRTSVAQDSSLEVLFRTRSAREIIL